ncbi:MAG: 16S rRNA (uracil(1498)-N(3))-methyltransferase [Bdellovibrionales bacterium]|nr:16S rRNA (uracil(1498)-N(3))-methyltransferase [Bdellovibrionales bacterium]
MRRFWYGKKPKDSSVLIEGELFHHIFDVCRFQEGSRFELLTEESVALFVEVESLQKKRAKVVVQEERVIPPLPQPWIHLCVSLPKFSTLEEILEKAVELGVHTLHPLISDFSFVKEAKKISDSKWERWQKIIVGATQQTGRGELLRVAPLTTLDKKIEEFNRKTKVQGLFLYEGQSPLRLHQALAPWKSQPLEEIWAFIGSEGGFSQQEVNVFERQSLPPVTLGRQILRVETACLAVASILKYEFGLAD